MSLKEQEFTGNGGKSEHCEFKPIRGHENKSNTIYISVIVYNNIARHA
jgi:hypothetical protein